MKHDNLFNPRWWVVDPNNGHPSVRKIAGYACVFILLQTSYATLWSDKPIDSSVLVPLLSAALAGCGIYAFATPSKERKDALH
jgi:hypothetical protein